MCAISLKEGRGGRGCAPGGARRRAGGPCSVRLSHLFTASRFRPRPKIFGSTTSQIFGSLPKGFGSLPKSFGSLPKHFGAPAELCWCTCLKRTGAIGSVKRRFVFYPLRRTPVYNRAPYRLVLWVKTLRALNAGADFGCFFFIFFRRRLCHGTHLSSAAPRNVP